LESELVIFRHGGFMTDEKSVEKRAEEWAKSRFPTEGWAPDEANMIAQSQYGAIQGYLAGHRDAWTFLPYPENKPEKYAWFIIKCDGDTIPAWWGPKGWEDGTDEGLINDRFVTAFLPIPRGW